MSDRELLELAANAAGMDGCEYRKSGPNNRAGMLFTNTLSVWNPLEDDGDAFRLTCDLGLRVFPVARTESGTACSAVGAVTGERMSEVADALPTRTATRQAIVRAAAEIGRMMQHE